MSWRFNEVVAAGLIGALVLAVALGFVWLPYDPLKMDLQHVVAGPSPHHWLGTDEFGRDVAARALLAARMSGAIALATTLASVSVGAALGVVAGFLRGWTERIVMALTDALLAFPAMLLALALVAVLGPSRSSIVVALAIAYVPGVTRIVRSAVLSIREREYVEASKVAGDGAFYTMRRHVLPNAIPPILIIATSIFGWSILSESALSFLGVGVPPPMPTWGNMLASARPYMHEDPLLSIAPGICIVLTLLGINMLGDVLRDRFDSRDEP